MNIKFDDGRYQGCWATGEFVLSTSGYSAFIRNIRQDNNRLLGNTSMYKDKLQELIYNNGPFWYAHFHFSFSIN